MVVVTHRYIPLRSAPVYKQCMQNKRRPTCVPRNHTSTQSTNEATSTCVFTYPTYCLHCPVHGRCNVVYHWPVPASNQRLAAQRGSATIRFGRRGVASSGDGIQTVLKMPRCPAKTECDSEYAVSKEAASSDFVNLFAQQSTEAGPR